MWKLSDGEKGRYNVLKKDVAEQKTKTFFTEFDN